MAGAQTSGEASMRKLRLKCYLIQPELPTIRACLAQPSQLSSYNTSINIEEIQSMQYRSVRETAALLQRHSNAVSADIDVINYEQAKKFAAQKPPPENAMFIVPKTLWRHAATINALTHSRITVMTPNVIRQFLENFTNNHRSKNDQSDQNEAEFSSPIMWRNLSSVLLDLCLHRKVIYFDVKTLGNKTARELTIKALQLGAKVAARLDPDDQVDIILANGVCSDAYHQNYRDPRLCKPVVSPQWLNLLFNRCRSERLSTGSSAASNDPFDSRYVNEHHLKPFEQLKICATGFMDLSERRVFEASLRNNGATYENSLSRDNCSHLVCKTPEGKKFEAARDWRTTAPVRPEWVYESIKRGYCLPYEKFSWLDAAATAELKIEYRLHAMTKQQLAELTAKSQLSQAAAVKAGVDTRDTAASSSEPSTKKSRADDEDVIPSSDVSARKNMPHSTPRFPEAIGNGLPHFEVSAIAHLSPAHATSSAAGQCNITRRPSRVARRQLPVIPEDPLRSHMHSTNEDADESGDDEAAEADDAQPTGPGSVVSSTTSSAKSDSSAQFRNPMLANIDFMMGLDTPTVPSSSDAAPNSSDSAAAGKVAAEKRVESATEAGGTHLTRHPSAPVPTVVCMSTQVPKQGLIGYNDPLLSAIRRQRTTDGSGPSPLEQSAEPSQILPNVPPSRPSPAFLGIPKAEPKTRTTVPEEADDDVVEVPAAIAPSRSKTAVAAGKTAQPIAKPMIFMITGYTEAEKPDVVNTLSCHARVLEVNMLDPLATHMLCSKLSRTEKILACIGHGVMLLHPSYVTACQRTQQLICDPVVLERQFEWGGEFRIRALRQEATKTTSSREVLVQSITLAEAAIQWRHIIRETGQKPMAGMVCAMELDTSRASPFERVIQAAGGKIVPLFDKNKAPMVLLKDLSIVFVDKKTAASPELVRRYDEILRAGVHVLNIEFVAQFLSTAYPTTPNAVFPLNMSDLIFPVVQEKCNAIGRALRMKPIWRALLGGRRLDLSVFQQQPPQPQPAPPAAAAAPLVRNGSVNGIPSTLVKRTSVEAANKKR